MYRLKKWKILFVLSLVINLLLIGVGSFIVNKQGGMAAVKSYFSSDQYTDYYLHKKRLFESFDYKKVDKVFLGDSITDHGELQTYFPGEVVLNRIDEVVKRNPKEVYILIGINDIGEEVDLDVYQKNMEKIIQSFDTKTTKVIVQSILPVNNKEFRNTISNETVDQFNEALQKLAEENGVQYVNLNQHFETADGQLKKEFTVDGVHLSDEGYDMWMENL
ncbi:MAG: GDSL-type esterase/lipase family protein [Paenisporosarcina sp.]|nr:GDSL-type esterase/lipase family protein [Paenisporosarcina sp.]